MLRQTPAAQPLVKGPRRNPITVSSCLQHPLPGHPPRMVNSAVSSSTRNLTSTEKSYSEDQQLAYICLFPDILSKARAKLEANEAFKGIAARVLDPAVDEDDRLIHALHPNRTGSALPSRVHTEIDTIGFINTKLVWPAVLILQLMKKLDGANLDDLPYAASVNGTRGVGTPDSALYSFVGDLARAFMEWKTANAMPESVIRELASTLRRHLSSGARVPVRVWWPDDTSDTSLSKEIKILFQIWCQIVSRAHISVAGVSSLNTTMFFYRHPAKPDVLFASEPLEYRWVTVMDFVAMFALGLGIVKLEDSDLPTLNQDDCHYMDSYYRRYPNPTPGLDKRNVAGILKQRKDWQANLPKSQKRKAEDDQATPTAIRRKSTVVSRMRRRDEKLPSASFSARHDGDDQTTPKPVKRARQDSGTSGTFGKRMTQPEADDSDEDDDGDL
ncbi:hypothetical protein EIP91_007580 [Steccherinum ochraceum]|uniref:Uncharacterized protein n=1 Tax=Steccherinum ochraceum TaxID=92696 RepID=A0A4R0S0Q2_9APHY|nr:hypothetical protein EIP91_007580 [Steccherinum ochraceum]